ncbi:MAG: HAD family hydrolase [Clostridia bacterium]|nr:HAD family hydrolase [Clostridia bacterium]
MIKNIIFDLYGTLVDIRTDETLPVLWERLAGYYTDHGALYDSSLIRERYHFHVEEEYLKARRLLPLVSHHDIDIKEVFRKMYEEKGLIPSDRYLSDTAWYFRRESTIFIRLYEGIEELLKKLMEEGRKIILLSNAQSAFTIPELRQLGIINMFDAVYISSDWNMAKPERLFFEKAIEEQGLEREETVMIGNDDISDIKGAKEAGLRTVYIRQAISPEPLQPIEADRMIMDGDVTRLYGVIKSLEG